jgi:hypothetical protein
MFVVGVAVDVSRVLPQGYKLLPLGMGRSSRYPPGWSHLIRPPQYPAR